MVTFALVVQDQLFNVVLHSGNERFVGPNAIVNFRPLASADMSRTLQKHPYSIRKECLLIQLTPVWSLAVPDQSVTPQKLTSLLGQVDDLISTSVAEDTLLWL